MTGGNGDSSSADAMAQAAGGVSAAEAAIIGAGISLAVALLTIAANAGLQRRAARRDAVAKQIDELYGPLRVLTIQSKALYDKLLEGKPEGGNWRLLDHLAEVADDPADRVIAEQIIEVNGRIETLIFDHAGLITDDEIPDSFQKFLGHYRFLKIAFEAVADSPAGSDARTEMTTHFSAKQSQYFPRTFDTDIETAFEELHAERQRLFEGWKLFKR